MAFANGIIHTQKHKRFLPVLETILIFLVLSMGNALGCVAGERKGNTQQCPFQTLVWRAQAQSRV